MRELSIRPAGVADVPGFRHIHRSCDDPWRDEYECRAWVAKRLAREFYIQYATLDGRPAGHGEWVVSAEPGGTFCYLGMLQVDADLHRRGVGRAMLADGAAYARRRGCPRLVTIPDPDTGAQAFYEACGWRPGRRVLRCALPAAPPPDGPRPWLPLAQVPFGVVAALPAVFGLVQVSSRHLWEVCNQKPRSDRGRRTPACLWDGSYIQFNYFPPSDAALALCWSRDPDLAAVAGKIRAFAGACGLNRVDFHCFEEHAPLFADFSPEYADLELFLPL